MSYVRTLYTRVYVQTKTQQDLCEQMLHCTALYSVCTPTTRTYAYGRTLFFAAKLHSTTIRTCTYMGKEAVARCCTPTQPRSVLQDQGGRRNIKWLIPEEAAEIARQAEWLPLIGNFFRFFPFYLHIQGEISAICACMQKSLVILYCTRRKRFRFSCWDIAEKILWKMTQFTFYKCTRALRYNFLSTFVYRYIYVGGRVSVCVCECDTSAGVKNVLVQTHLYIVAFSSFGRFAALGLNFSTALNGK